MSTATATESQVGRKVSNAVLWRGLLAIAVGAVAVVWPNITVGAFVILFAVYAFVAAVADAGRAFSSERGWSVVGYLLLSLVSVAAGVVALVWPGPTALALTLIVGWWALFTGVVEIAMAFTSGRRAGQRAWFILSGLVSIVFAAALFIRPDLGAVSLAIVFGLYSIFYGVTALVLRSQVRSLDQTAHRLTHAVA
ncbi:HdeD family acid-resistance protein [Kribbella sp. NPDC055071]